MATSTLVATAKSSTANSYCTLAEADQYHDDRPAVSTTWADASDGNKTKALQLERKIHAMWRRDGTPCNDDCR